MKKSTITKSKDILTRSNESENTISVLKLDEYGAFYEISGVAREFWNLIDGKKTEEDLIQKLSKEYPDAVSELKKQAKTWVKDFRKHGLID